MENTQNSPKTDKPWLFKKGQSGNPGGRPKGKSMKEYARYYLASMTEEERLNFLEGIPKVDIWKLAEGAPDTKSNIDLNGDVMLNTDKIKKLAQELNKKRIQRSRNIGGDGAKSS